MTAMSRIKDFNLPDLGEGLTEGEILSWLVKVGDTIELNQPIVEVETAKAAVEIPAKWAGVVTQIHHEAGTTVEVGHPIISIDTDPTAGPVPSAESLAAVEIAPEEGAIEPGMIGGPAPGGRTAVLVGYGPKTTTAKRRARIGTDTRPPTATPVRPPLSEPPPPPVPQQPEVPVAPANGHPVLAKPPVRKLAKDMGVDLSTITGSGPLGSVTREDVQRAAAQPSAEPDVTRPAPVAAPVFDASREQRIPIKGVRKLTAENMVASAFTAPHVTEFLTVDVTRSMKALDRLRAQRK